MLRGAMRTLKLSTRIVLIGVLITLCFSCILAWTYVRIRASTYEAQTEKTKHLVQPAWGVLDYYGGQARAGKMNVEQAQRAAVESIKTLRYGQDNYFWINDRHPRMIMHPTNAALDGKDLSDYKDPTGFRLFVEMARVCDA